MKIFDLSKSFPKEEKYSLTDQIRRSSRSVPANLAELFEKENIQSILFLRLLIVNRKQQKHKFG